MSKNDCTGLEVAIIGIALRFPGASTVEQFWSNMIHGVESISFFTPEELKESGVSTLYASDPHYVPARGILEHLEYFDSQFFNYVPSDAGVMDPQLRILHECSWEALENAGYVPDKYQGLIGNYVGGQTNLKWVMHLMSKNMSGDYFGTLTLNGSQFLSTRVSYSFNLQGPSYTVQTACSSSLVAVHLACQGLLSGECDIALAGGVAVTLPQKTGYYHQEGMIKSRDGHCRPFDGRASGTVGGNGVGVVVLKRLEEALEDGDTIHAIIKGSAINNDGSDKVGYTAPSIGGQSKTIKTAQRMANVEPETVRYVEAHGTGTAIGDPIEVEALNLAFDTPHRSYCGLGSVKSNIGHLDSAAGVAGLIKTVLILKNRIIPPTVNFQIPNPRISLIDTPFYLVTQPVSCETLGDPLRAGVSSFGIGGTNAHVVLEEAPITKEITSSKPYHLILLSAQTEGALERMSDNLAHYLAARPNLSLADVAYTLQHGRKNCSQRRMLVASNTEEAVHILLSRDGRKLYSFAPPHEVHGNVFVFSGQEQYTMNVGREFYEHATGFRQEVDQCIALVKSLLGVDLSQVIFHSAEGEGNATHLESSWKGLFLFIIQYAFAQYLLKYGVKPQAMISQGVGEYVAACLSGVYSLEDAITLVVKRSQVLSVNGSSDEYSVRLTEFTALLQNMTFSVPKIRYGSGMTGNWVTGEMIMSPDYWLRHLHGVDRVDGRVEWLCEDSKSVWIVFGSKMEIQTSYTNRPAYMVYLMKDPHDPVCDLEYVYTQLGILWMAGVKMDWAELYADEKRRRIPLPTYSFEKIRYDTEVLSNVPRAGEIPEGSAQIHEAKPLRQRIHLPEDYAEPRNEQEEKIAQIFQEALGIDTIGIYEDFFELGGDSLKAIQVVGRLSKEFSVELNTLFQHPTVAQLTEQIKYKKDALLHQMKELMAPVHVDSDEQANSTTYFAQRHKEYLAKLPSCDTFDLQKVKSYTNILLTGVTGFVGIHLLERLLHDTETNLTLLIRGSSLVEAMERLKAKYQYYFQNYLDLTNRVKICPGDITEDQFGLTPEAYTHLADQVDCIIHSAGNSSHFGRYEEFESTNVQGVQRIIAFAKVGRKKDIHHMSTTAVCRGRYPHQRWVGVGEDEFDLGQQLHSHYAQSKLEAEKRLISAREDGIEVNIYRLGNVSFHSETGIFQDNKHQNAIFATMKSFIQLGKIPDLGITFDFGFVDYVSRAILLLFDRADLMNQTFHIYNPYSANLADLLTRKGIGVSVDRVGREEVLQYIYENYDHPQLGSAIDSLRVHLLGRRRVHPDERTEIRIYSDKTNRILNQLGFAWQPVEKIHLQKMVRHCQKVKFFE